MKELRPDFIRLKPQERLYQLKRPIVAITGGIATGKSTVKSLLEKKGLKIIDADQLVKSIYATQEAKDFIQKNYPACFSSGEINFKKLRELVFADEAVKNTVESFIYQRLPQSFLEAASKITDQEFYIYDVPLLFERGLERVVDQKVVVYAPRKIQQARIIDRDKSSENTARQILDQQMDIEVKKEKADFIINNAGTLEELTAEVEELLRKLFIL